MLYDKFYTERKEICVRIKAFRKERRWKQEDVCLLLSISKPAYSNIESGKTDINISRLIQICKVFKIQLSDLLKDKNIDNESNKKVELIEQKLRKEIEKRDNEIISLQSLLISVLSELHQKRKPNLEEQTSEVEFFK